MSGNLQLSRRTHRSLLLRTHDELERQYRQQRHPKDLFEELLDQSCQQEEAGHIHSNPELSETHVLSPTKEPAREEGCRCSKIGCLKLYCVCFASGKFCSAACACSCCSNTMANEMEVAQVRLSLIRRKSAAFDTNAKKTGVRCSCKQSGCSKRYCECFKMGIGCGEGCSCTDCGNRTTEGRPGQIMGE